MANPVARGIVHVDNNAFNSEFFSEFTLPGVLEEAQRIGIAHGDDLAALPAELLLHKKELAHVLHYLGGLRALGLALMRPDLYARRSRTVGKSVRTHPKWDIGGTIKTNT